MGFYIEQTDRAPKSRPAAEDLYPGELVHENGSDQVELADAASHTNFDGVVRKPRSGEGVVFDMDDSGNYFIDASSDHNRAVYGGDADRDVIKVRTIEETTDGVTTAPSLADGDIAVVVDTSNADAPSSPGRVVENGYTNDENNDSTTTTFSLSAGNVIGVGRVYKDSASSFDEPVRLEVRRDL